MGCDSVYTVARRAVEDGWVQGELHSGRGVCLVGAFTHAQMGSNWNYEVQRAVVRRLRRYPWFWLCGPPMSRQSVERWNDAPWRRKSRVLKVLYSLERDALVRENERLRAENYRLGLRAHEAERELDRLTFEGVVDELGRESEGVER